jgi:hypothetical protein
MTNRIDASTEIAKIDLPSSATVQTTEDNKVQDVAKKVVQENADKAQLPAPKEIGKEVVKIEAPVAQPVAAPVAPVAQPVAAPVAQPAVKLTVKEKYQQLKATCQKAHDALDAGKRAHVNKYDLKQLEKAVQKAHDARHEYKHDHKKALKK